MKDIVLDELPKLPEPVMDVYAADQHGYTFLTAGKWYYTPDQMREYARAAIAALASPREPAGVEE